MGSFTTGILHERGRQIEEVRILLAGSSHTG
jgi:hypothetical protein